MDRDDRFRITSFPPVIDGSSRILVLGSMPGVESLRQRQYYANPRNQFWRIIHAVFGSEPSPLYAERIAFVLSRGIALWDVFESCSRTGSLDSRIREGRVNDFPSFFRLNPGIGYVLFNGAKAYDTFGRHDGFTDDAIIYRRMPSTSPAHAVGFEKILEEWMVIREYLGLPLLDRKRK